MHGGCVGTNDIQACAWTTAWAQIATRVPVGLVGSAGSFGSVRAKPRELFGIIPYSCPLCVFLPVLSGKLKCSAFAF